MGILRMLVDDLPRARDLLQTAGSYGRREPHSRRPSSQRPGALAAVARLVADSGLDIEYIYLGARDSLLLKTEELERLERLLLENGFRVLEPGDLS